MEARSRSHSNAGGKFYAISNLCAHQRGDSVSSYPVQVSNGKIYVSAIPSAVGKRTSKPHQAYRELDSVVKQHLANMTGSQVLPVGVHQHERRCHADGPGRGRNVKVGEEEQLR